MSARPAGDYVCACGHLLADHEPPGGKDREPWGACRVDLAPAGPGPMVRCDCREAWPMEDPS